MKLYERLEALDTSLSARDYMVQIGVAIDESDLDPDAFENCGQCPCCGAADDINDAIDRRQRANPTPVT